MNTTGSHPTISIVTASYNQVPYIAQCIDSVLSQATSNVEYIVIDGGSTDGTAEVISGFGPRLSYWHSRPDAGQYHALNEGFSRATGDVLGWINADDFLLPNALSTIGSLFSAMPEVQWVTTRTIVNCDVGGRMTVRQTQGVSRQLWAERRDSVWIMQEGTFWRRELFESASQMIIPPQLSHAADLELWNRFFCSV